jgi:predicted amidophosphoribosyltransferase
MNSPLRALFLRGSTLCCPLCRDVYSGRDLTDSICDTCRSELDGSPGPFEIAPDRADDDRWVIAATEYGGIATRVLERVKIGGDIALLRLIARRTMSGLIDRFPADDAPIALVPIPASISGRRVRGFDQSRVVAHEIARTRLDAIHVEALVRRRRGVGLKHLGREDRFASGAAQYTATTGTAAIASHSRVIIVDDVVTTGASMLAVRDILRGLGSTDIRGIAFAYRT